MHDVIIYQSRAKPRSTIPAQSSTPTKNIRYTQDIGELISWVLAISLDSTSYYTDWIRITDSSECNRSTRWVAGQTGQRFLP